MTEVAKMAARTTEQTGLITPWTIRGSEPEPRFRGFAAVALSPPSRRSGPAPPSCPRTRVTPPGVEIRPHPLPLRYHLPPRAPGGVRPGQGDSA